MKSKIILLILGMVALIATVVACSDNPSFGGQDDQNKELILKAKSLVQAQGNAVSLPIPDSQQQNQARSTSYLADLTPLWDNVITYKSGDETILIVPLQSDEEIKSKVIIKQGDETTYQFAKTFSRLIVKGEQAYVLTYMPESEYASTHSDIENELRYNPTEVNFTGMIVSSKLNGKVNWGYVYENGALIHYVAPSHKCHDSNCTEIHKQNEHFYIKTIFNITDKSRSYTTYTTRTEENHCPYCYKLAGICDCIDWENYCLICNNYKDMCICNTNVDKCIACLQNPCVCDKLNICPWCGRPYYNGESHSCEPGICEVCKTKPCICYTPPKDDEKEFCPTCGKDPCECPEPPIQIDTCDICKQEPCACCDICGTYPCLCITNTYPVNYEAHDNDFLIGEESAYQSSGDCCAMAVVAMAHRAYGAETTESDMSQLYTQLNYMSPEEPTILDVNSTFMTLQFDMGTTTNLAQTAISNVIIVRNNNHYILVVGVQYDGDLIYADPHNGGLYVVNASYFSGCDNIVIYGNGGKSLKMINQDK